MTDITKTLRTLRDLLAGAVPDPRAQVEQITLALLYKFADDIDREGMALSGKRLFFSGDEAPYAWTALMALENPKRRAALYGEALERMAGNPHLPALFRDIFRGASLPCRDPDVLEAFLREIDGLAYSEDGAWGQVYESLLSSMGRAGDAGQFRVPGPVADLLVDILDPKKEERILDPACGTGGFLAGACRHILEETSSGGGLPAPGDRKRLSENLTGYDRSPAMARLARMNLFLHQVPGPNIQEYDALAGEEKWGEAYDVILSAPPFMTPKGGIAPHGRYRISSGRSELLFVDYIAEHLSPRGRAGVIVPRSFGFLSGGAYRRLRAYLVDGNLLYGVIALPAGTLSSHSAVEASVLLLDKDLAPRREHILFAKLGLPQSPSRRRSQTGGEAQDILQAVRAFQAGEDPGPFAVLVEKARFPSRDYSLEAGEYQPRPKAGGTYPLVRLGDVCGVNAEAVNPGLAFGDGPFLYLDSSALDPESGGPDAAPRLPGNQAPAQARRAVRPGDVLVSPEGPAAGYVDPDARGPWVASTSLAVLSAGKDILPKFLYYLLSGGPLAERLSSLGDAGQAELEDLLLPLPPLSVQEEIAAELDYDRSMAEGARALVRRYRPVIHPEPDWETAAVGDLVRLEPGRALPERTEGACPVYGAQGPMGCHGDYFLESPTLVIPREAAACLTAPRSWVTDGAWMAVRYLRPVNPAYLALMLNQVQGDGPEGLRSLEDVCRRRVPLPDAGTQDRLMERIYEERAAVEANRTLAERFEEKLRDRLRQIWRE